MIDRIDSELLPQRTAINLRAFRQEMLASNIANADTPHYKARDVDFKTAYANAVRGQAVGDIGLNRTAKAHLPGDARSPYGDALRYRAEYQGAVDGNTVNMDVERAAFAENAIHMEASLTFIRERLRGLASAVQGQ
jgi:flagellar basal-body rod protein FlgB